MSYTFNKAPKDKDLLKLIRRAITKDIRANGLTLEEFANEIGLSAGTLDNKLKPSCETNVLNLDEFIHILDITADYEPLEYIAKRYGFTLCRPGERVEQVENPELVVMRSVLDIGSHLGRLDDLARKILEDGIVDEDEKRNYAQLLYELGKVVVQYEITLRQRRKKQ